MRHRKQALTPVLVIIPHDLSLYTLLVYMTTHLIRIVGLSNSSAFLINTINLILLMVTNCLGGWSSDRTGRKPVLIGACLFLLIGTIPLTWPTFSHSMSDVLLAQIPLSTVGIYLGPLAVIMTESFPTPIRYSAISIVININGPLFGGTTPMLIAYSINKTSSEMVQAYYLPVEQSSP
nr:MFS transporter [Pajaroellobacter abortibovis]